MLNNAQLITLRNYIASVPTLNSKPMNSDGAWEIAEALKADSNPAVIVWKTDVTVDSVMRNGIDWARVDNLSVGKARIWEWMTKLGTINASKTNVRAGIDATWVGTAADLAVRAQVYTHCKRTANILEALFAVGAGTDASPSVMAVEGYIGYQEVAAARNLV